MLKETPQEVQDKATEDKISVEEAEKVLMEEEKKRQDDCAKELNEVLAKHGYVMKFQVVPHLVNKE